MTIPIRIAPLRPEDKPRWLVHARGYKAFYKTIIPDADYETCWRRLMAEDRIHGLGATVDGQLVGIAHYLFHTTIWAESACYLQDLFTDPAMRGKGVARKLIESVAAAARTQGAARYYWLTQTHNTAGRVLYDKVAKYNDFIRYEYPLD